MENSQKYKNEIDRVLGDIENLSDMADQPIRKLLEKQDIADGILKKMKADNEEGPLFESLLAYSSAMVRAEQAKDRIEDMTLEIIHMYKKRMQHILSEQTFVHTLSRYLSIDKNLSIMERIDGSFVFDKVVDRVLMNQPIHPKILELDPNKDYRLDEIEEIDEGEALKAQKEAFNYILNEEEQVEFSSNDYFQHRAKGVKKTRKGGEEFYEILSLTIGKGYAPMFAKGESFELNGEVYNVIQLDMDNRFATRNVTMGRIDGDALLKLRIRIPIHYQRYTCKKIK